MIHYLFSPGLLPTPGSPPLGLLGLIIIPIIIAAIFITIAIICIVIYWKNLNKNYNVTTDADTNVEN